MEALQRIGLRTIVVAVMIFLPAPILIVALSSFTSSGYMNFPPSGFSIRWYLAFLGSADWLWNLAASLLVAAIVSLVSTAFAFLPALIVGRRRFPPRNAFTMLVLAPMIFPHAVLGIGLD